MSCVSLVVKLATTLPYYESMMARCFGISVFSIPIMIYDSQPFIPTSLNDAAYIFGRSFFGSIAGLCLLGSFNHIPIGDATALAFTSPVWSAILAYFLLNEGWSPIFDTAAVILCLTGTVLITRPSFIFPPEKPLPGYDMAWYAYASAFAASVFLALSYICVRKIKNKGQTTAFIFYYGVVGFPISIIIGLCSEGFIFAECNTLDNIYALLCGVFSFLGQICLISALRLEKAAVVALGRAADIAFVFILQVVVIHTSANALSIVGAILVLSCNFGALFKRMFPDKQSTE